MLLSEFLQTRGNFSVQGGITQPASQERVSQKNEQGNTFADELKMLLDSQSAVKFSSHAVKRIESRDIDIDDESLERLNKGVELAAEKGCSESLILIDNTAFIVSVANNKVITTLTPQDMKGNVFTNIDSTVII